MARVLTYSSHVYYALYLPRVLLALVRQSSDSNSAASGVCLHVDLDKYPILIS